jgi:hypothetical protein
MVKSLALLSIENEIKGLHTIIQDQKEVISEKDKEILELQRTLERQEKVLNTLSNVIFSMIKKKEF